MSYIVDNKLEELMVITMEECGELIQRCSKYIRYGDSDGIKEEVGDVYTMIELMIENGIISWEEINDRVKVKKDKLSKWSNLIK